MDWNRIADFLGFVEEISLVTFKEEGELEFDLRTSGPSRVSESDNGARDWYGRRRELTRKEWEKEEAKGGYKLPKATVLTNNGNRFYWIVWALARLLAEEEIDVAHRLGLTSEIPQVHQQEDLVGNIWTLRERADQEYGGWRLREGGDHECWIVSPSS